MADTPDTAATRFLTEHGIPHRLVGYGRVRSAEEAAEARGIELSALVKTLVIRVEEGSYILALVPGDRGLDYPKLRQYLGVRRLTMPDPEEAKMATGYERGTITPFAAGEHRIVIDQRLVALPEISLGVGAHGWAVHLHPDEVVALGAESADISG